MVVVIFKYCDGKNSIFYYLYEENIFFDSLVCNVEYIVCCFLSLEIEYEWIKF